MYFSSTDADEVIEYSVYDMIGNQIISPSTTTEANIHIDRLPAGMYLIHWKAADDINWTESRFVKMK